MHHRRHYSGFTVVTAVAVLVMLVAAQSVGTCSGCGRLVDWFSVWGGGCGECCPTGDGDRPRPADAGESCGHCHHPPGSAGRHPHSHNHQPDPGVPADPDQPEPSTPCHCPKTIGLGSPALVDAAPATIEDHAERFAGVPSLAVETADTGATPACVCSRQANAPPGLDPGASLLCVWRN